MKKMKYIKPIYIKKARREQFFKRFLRYAVTVSSCVLIIILGTKIMASATTIGTNISTGGTLSVTGANTFYGATSIGGAITATSTLTVTGLTTLGNASTTLLSISNIAYIGGATGLILADGSITDASGSIDFGNENLSTTGNLTVGDGTPDVTLDGEDVYIEGTFEVDGAARFDSPLFSMGGEPLSSLATNYSSRGDLVNVVPPPDVTWGGGTDFLDAFDMTGETEHYWSGCSRNVIRQTGTVEKVGIWVADAGAWAAGNVDEVRIIVWRRDIVAATNVWDDSWDIVATSENIAPAVATAADSASDQRVYITLTNKMYGAEVGDFVGLMVDKEATPTDGLLLTEWVDDGTSNAGKGLLIEDDLIAHQNFDWETNKDGTVNANGCLQVELFMQAPQVVINSPSFMSGWNSLRGHIGMVWGGCTSGGDGDCANVDFDIDKLAHDVTPGKYFSDLTGMTYQHMGIAGHFMDEQNASFSTYIAPLKPRILIQPAFNEVEAGGSYGTGIGANLISVLDQAKAADMVVVLVEFIPLPQVLTSSTQGFASSIHGNSHYDNRTIKEYVAANYDNVIWAPNRETLGVNTLPVRAWEAASIAHNTTTCTGGSSPNIVTSSAHSLQIQDTIGFAANGAGVICTGMGAFGTEYYVSSVPDSTTFTITSSIGNVPLTFTSAGTAFRTYYNGTHAKGDLILPTTDNCDGTFLIRATNAGTVGASEPEWNCGNGALTVDNDITWSFVNTEDWYGVISGIVPKDYQVDISGHLTALGNAAFARTWADALGNSTDEDEDASGNAVLLRGDSTVETFTGYLIDAADATEDCANPSQVQPSKNDCVTLTAFPDTTKYRGAKVTIQTGGDASDENSGWYATYLTDTTGDTILLDSYAQIDTSANLSGEIYECLNRPCMKHFTVGEADIIAAMNSNTQYTLLSAIGTYNSYRVFGAWAQMVSGTPYTGVETNDTLVIEFGGGMDIAETGDIEGLMEGFNTWGQAFVLESNGANTLSQDVRLQATGDGGVAAGGDIVITLLYAVARSTQTVDGTVWRTDLTDCSGSSGYVCLDVNGDSIQLINDTGQSMWFTIKVER